jgi:hypothetical protein
LNYLDITIENINNTFTFGIYRKPTATDLIIHSNSCHPTEHKHAAIRYTINRLNKYPISPSNKHKETQLINTILRNNGYPPHTYTHKQVTNKITNTVQQQKQKWATFTYTGNHTRAITKLFKNNNIRIAYRTNNTIRNYLQNKDHNSDKYSQGGIYELKCSSCQLKYIGQTGRNFRVRYKEHIRLRQSTHSISWKRDTPTAL